MVSTRLSRLRQTSQKHQRVDHAITRPGIQECLPRDALEAVMGTLDRESLCTARLVSKTFCAAASAHVCNLTLASTSQAVSFLRFPHLRHVTVTHSYGNVFEEDDEGWEDRVPEEESMAQLDPCLQNLAQALTVRERDHLVSNKQTRDFLAQAALMPKLRKLEVEADVHHEAALLARCTSVEALAFEDCSISVARTIITMTRLTSLHIGRVLKDDAIFAPADVSCLGHATNLRNLKALSIEISPETLPLIGNLTGLTGLTACQGEHHAGEATFSIAPLTRLTRLRTLSLMGEELTESNLDIACSLASGSLVNLQLEVCHDAPADCGKYLSRQTALTQLSLRGRQLCNLRHIGALRIELLKSLELDGLHRPGAAGLSGLCRATSLTRLAITLENTKPHKGLSQALARLTQLRSLSLASGDEASKFLDLPLALSPLTAFTKLEIARHRLDDGNLRALLVLTGLRALDLEWCRLTDKVMPQLGALTNLSRLRL